MEVKQVHSKKKVMKSTRAQPGAVPTFSSTNLRPVLDWISEIVRLRTSALSEESVDACDIEVPKFESKILSDFESKFKLGTAEVVVVALLLLNKLRPGAMDLFLLSNPETGKPYREFGGIIDRHTYRFKPTLRTALFLLSGINEDLFIHFQNILRRSNVLFVEQIVNLYNNSENEHYLPESVIDLDQAYVDYLLSGETPRLDSGANFPARLLETQCTMSDLVVKDSVKAKLQPVLDYMRVQSELYNDPYNFQ